MLDSVEEEKPPGKKTLGEREEPILVTNPTHTWHQAIIEPGPCGS